MKSMKANLHFINIYFKNDDIKSKLWLCLPAITAEIFDATVTLLGQPDEYWKGSFYQVNEFNPMAHWALTIHPLVFAGYVIAECTFVSLLIVILPLTLSKIFSTAWTIGSAKAIYNWLAWTFHLGWWISNLALFVPAIILVYAFERCQKGMSPHNT